MTLVLFAAVLLLAYIEGASGSIAKTTREFSHSTYKEVATGAEKGILDGTYIEGRPMPVPEGTEVTIFKADNSTVAASVLTDTKGKFHAELEEGEYVIYDLIKGCSNAAPRVRRFSISRNKTTSIIIYQTCAKCLPPNTLIETPSGQAEIKHLRDGMKVWTTGANGQKQEATIIETVQVKVTAGQAIVHFLLQDGRELFVSPNHPLADGRTASRLSAGDFLDGSKVVIAKLVEYTDTETHDILPSGGTGTYWANGIPLRSTLFSP